MFKLTRNPLAQETARPLKPLGTWLVPLAGMGAGCGHLQPLDEEPFASARAGAWTVSSRLVGPHHYATSGTFEADTPGGLQTAEDDGTLRGLFTWSLGFEHYLMDDWSLGLTYDRRTYDVQDLDPINDPNLGIEVSRTRSDQISLWSRHLLPAWGGTGSRWRPFLMGGISYFPGIELTVTGSSPILPTPLTINTTSESFFTGLIGGGVAIDLGARLLAELGAMAEFSLADFNTDLSLSIGPSDVPFDAELDLFGVYGYLGLQYHL